MILKLTKKIFIIVFSFVFSMQIVAQDDKENEEEKGLPLKATRAIDINTSEGTWISLDVHPSGEKIIFDLLGDIYELPISGGKANRITEGLAFDSQPKYSPDGNSILLVINHKPNRSQKKFFDFMLDKL